jgi:F-box-like
MERYGLHFRETIDPFYSIFAINEQRRKIEATEGAAEIEREKAAEEQTAMDEGDLLATYTRPEDLVRQRNLYRREKARLRAEKKRRRLTGENWSLKTDGVTQKPFWYNADSGEALWDKPLVILELEAHDLAREKGWGKIPHKPLVKIMEFLIPFPERQTCSAVCRHWRAASQDFLFVRHIYPVEMGALSLDRSRREPNHYATIDEALKSSQPGDTIGTLVARATFLQLDTMLSNINVS